ncbi:aminopeptidase P N-terminal domain-containing protein [Aquabacterium sp. A7-Y]|uniref:aminopeptidase P N-terminal domain-containing protein n=1 Tax=Aquabacterium sp. A7-Y TaxID=1349605 RepID=UPI00223D9C1E|nr:aminopeptidase P N-terminal domain-containing protein [Aquabacterium sp. A7-Y]MCW7536665.1 aminopeptidase P N-terminal domain-containing protein [Aquabacterium sp. A7-Y]
MDRSTYSRRRMDLAGVLRAGGGGVAVLPTAPERIRNRDTTYPYRHDSYFYYLSGFTEPDSWLVIDDQGHSTLFCRPKDPEREIWDGIRLGPDAAPGVLGVDAAFPVETLDERLPQLLANRPAVAFPFGLHPGLESRVEMWLSVLRAQERRGIGTPQTLRDLTPALDEMRLIKDEGELAVMRQAGRISAAAHLRAMQSSARWMRTPGEAPWREYHLEAELLHEFRRRGAQAPAYPSIVAAGANACVLHYAAGDTELKPGELCLIDAGCELDGYASDITRTFPVDGRFTTPQRELYDLVLAAQDAAVAATRPGARQRDAHHAAVRVLSEGMLALGLLNRDRHGSVDDVIEHAHYRQFYMHGTGHWIGMDVHDVGNYLQDDEAPVEQPDGLGGRVVKKPSRVLQPGMVVTLEPGLYVRPADGVPERYWNTGIRIEDDAVVTPGGCELITRDVPVQAEAIEALMRQA